MLSFICYGSVVSQFGFDLGTEHGTQSDETFSHVRGLSAIAVNDEESFPAVLHALNSMRVSVDSSKKKQDFA